MSELVKSIMAEKRELNILLASKFEIDYFQREYKWERRHVEQLLVDLEAAFISNYKDDHTLENVDSYNQYYMGPVILADKGGIRSIVDGQQRLTSITLLLIYLHNQLNGNETADDIKRLIISRKGSRTSFNIESKERHNILNILFEGRVEEVNIESERNYSVKNIYERYCDIQNMYPDSLSNDVMPLFADWLREKVVFVEILAYSMDNAYTIFETMNDRGLNLTPTEMMKGYLLTNVGIEEKIEELDSLWKKRLSELNLYSIQEDLEFIRAWLRAIYAVTIRESAKGAENQDFEKIGTRFHSWLRDKAKDIGLVDNESFYYFIKGDFDFYSSLYLKIKAAEVTYTEGLETLYLSSYWSIASSLSYPLLIASINKLDDEQTINQKLATVSKFLDIYTITRILSGKSITQTVIRYAIYSLVKEIRNSDLDTLRNILKEKLLANDSMASVMLYQYDWSQRKFIHYVFARIIFYLENKYRNQTADNYWIDDLMAPRRKDRYVIAPIITDDFNVYSDSFQDNTTLLAAYASLGNYVLIPNPLAEEFNEIITINKIALLKNENLLAALAVEPYEIDDDIKLSYDFNGVKRLDFESILGRTRQLYYIINEVWNVDDI